MIEAKGASDVCGGHIAARSQTLRLHGFGVVSGYGWGLDRLIHGLADGKSAAVLDEHLGPDVGPCWMARVPVDPARHDGESTYVSAVRSAVAEAISRSMAAGWRPGPAVGIVVASARGDVEACQDLYLEQKAPQSSRRQYVSALPSTLLQAIMHDNGFTGPALSLSASCAGGLAALHVGRALLRAGAVSDLIVVAADVGVSKQTVLPLAELGPLRLFDPPEVACRPFHDASAGFTFGEGAVAVVASMGSAPAIVSVLATNSCSEPVHPLSLNPDATLLIRFMTETVTQAGMELPELEGFVPHASGTVQCNRTEGQLLASLPSVRFTPLLKPLLGHARAAASLLELAAVGHCSPARLPLLVAAQHSGFDGTRTAPISWVQASLGFGGNASFAVFRTEADSKIEG